MSTLLSSLSASHTDHSVRKNLGVEKGEHRLLDEVRFFFYITNHREMTAHEIVVFANDRFNQDNVIGQLKSGVDALRMPADDLESNWAYMVIAALAWNLKAWYGLVTQTPATRRDILRMEFKHYLVSFVQIPCQIVNTGRRPVFRVPAYSRHLETFFATFDHIRSPALLDRKSPVASPCRRWKNKERAKGRARRGQTDQKT